MAKDEEVFWNKERTVRVELMNPRLTVEGQLPLGNSQTVESPRIETSRFHLDTVLKLAALIATIANAALLILGYMRYLAQMELFGIARSEVSYSISDLLAYGYGAFLNLIFSGRPAQLVFGASVGVLVVVLFALFGTGRSSWRKDAATMAVAVAVAAVPAIPMLMGYVPAKDSALALAAKHLQVVKEDLRGVRKRFEIDTSQGVVSGDVLLANSEYTYLLAGNVVYKLKTENNVVVRKTYLEADLSDGRE
ncbi:hypothetical protein [Metapseudomonas furukawaii]|uniref:hypothetical protein n=1 Tax=Metapseudomonas furukawaii TaxID=1149133 RepID=UPI000567FAB2|nr:hypothetical protein [Pseudomonas furukawaii]